MIYHAIGSANPIGPAVRTHDRDALAVKILGIETSCDETGVAVYTPDAGVLAEALFSQVDLHARFGGVVPELAARDHIAKLTPMIRDVLSTADLELTDLDAVAYTAGPGLIGALMVGGAVATGLAVGLDIPVIPVHHMEAHLLAAMLEADPPGCRSSPCWSPAGTRCWWKRERSASTAYWERPWTMPPARRSTRWPACWICRIRAGPLWHNWPRAATRRRSDFRGR